MEQGIDIQLGDVDGTPADIDGNAAEPHEGIAHIFEHLPSRQTLGQIGDCQSMDSGSVSESLVTGHSYECRVGSEVVVCSLTAKAGEVRQLAGAARLHLAISLAWLAQAQDAAILFS
jgi:hypothetical protein